MDNFFGREGMYVQGDLKGIKNVLRSSLSLNYWKCGWDFNFFFFLAFDPCLGLTLEESRKSRDIKWRIYPTTSRKRWIVYGKKRETLEKKNDSSWGEMSWKISSSLLMEISKTQRFRKSDALLSSLSEKFITEVSESWLLIL